jgi:hypothetical protein
MQTIRRFLIFFAVQFLLLSFALPSWASEDPLRLAFINASQKGGGDAHETLLEFLDASDDIKVKDSDKIWDAAEEEGVSRKDFRNSKRRDSSAREFRRVMKSLNIEAIMILDVFSKGKKLQLVVIGPSGKTIADVRENIKRGKVSKAESKTILKEAFAELVPQVRDFRDAGGWDAVDDEPRKEDPVEEPDEEDPDEEDPDEEDPDSSTSLKDSAVASNNGDFGLEPGFTFRFGALVGSRSFTMESEGGFKLDHKSPFVGVTGRLDATLSVFSDGSSAIGASVFGGYAPFTTLFDGTEEFASDYGRLGAELVFKKAFSDQVLLDIFGGAEVWSITIDKNPFYTGNRYLSARLGGFLSYTAGPLVIGGGAGLLPTFDINNSDGAFGATDLAFGIEGQAAMSFQVTDSIDARIGYTFTTISPEYPEPKVIGTPDAPDPISSTDTIHSGMVTLGYRL